MNKSKHYTLTLLLASLLFIAGCQGVDLGMSEEEFKQKVIEANTDVNTYVIISNEKRITTLDFPLLGEPQKSEVERETRIAFDTVNKNLEMQRTQKPLNTEDSEVTQITSYVVQDSIFETSDNTWRHQKTPEYVWDEQHDLQEQVWLFESGQMQILRETEIAGETYIVVQVRPGLNEIEDLMSGFQEITELLEEMQTDIASIVQDLEVTMWIHNETYLIRTSEENIYFDLEREGIRITLDTESTKQINNINEPVNITVPTEALQATQSGKVSFWCGKVNQHYKDGHWQTDPDGRSGCEVDHVQYCRKWFSNTISAIEFGEDTISGWKDAGNVGDYTSTKTTYSCIEE